MMLDRTESDIMKYWQDGFEKPLVSICTRTYNLEKFIEQALDSFLMQNTDFPFEIVIDDDCSTDSTADILMEYKKKYPNIINENILKKNIGVRMNFIGNLQRANGKYIAPCDGDDYWTDNKMLQKHVDFLDKHEEYVVSYGPLEPLFEEGAVRRKFNWNRHDREAIDIQKHFLGTGICAVCFRNVEIIKSYPYEHHCAPIDDNFLGSMLGAYGKGKFLYDIEPAFYRQHANSDYSSKTQKQKALMYQQTYFALAMYYLRINEVSLSEYFQKKVSEYSFVLYGRKYYIRMLLTSFKNDGILFIKSTIVRVLKMFKLKK
ncbi:MAG TPA: glycosyltransferase [Campylobacterales bacterium]|nr:glycosyltransferase [Campylobacterales bacterium]